ncbi:hypothetical protein ACFE04_000498 [Oxalis oulophora]
MASTFPISLICCLVICLRIKTAHADCYGTGNFTANSTYSKNRDILMASLASNAAANGGFYNSSVGEGSDTVYATAMCSGYDTQTGCSSCVNTSAYSLLKDCPYQYEGVSWSGCVVHYANTYIFGVKEMSPRQILFNTGTISWNRSDFYETWVGLVEKLKIEAASGTSRLKYAVGKENFTLTQYMYAQLQCTPDLSLSDCDHCLRKNIDDYETYCSGYVGGVVNTPSCKFRWDMYRFFTDIVDNAPPPSPNDPPSPPPSSPPSRLSSMGNGGLSAKKITIIVGSVAFFVALVAVVGKDITASSEYLHLEFGTVRAATSHFSDNKKLGQGGFGTVYKASNNQYQGTLINGQEIAVKRLSQNSKQGELEFKTEVKLMTKLRHRNLVRLIGFSLEKEERVLVYEFLPNSSLDRYVFRKAALLFRVFHLATCLDSLENYVSISDFGIKQLAHMS